ncbi:MAG: alpha/beta hydrolase, partial [Acidimicrobiia bacterium]
RLAIDCALAHPERVRALVLVGSGVRGAPAVEGIPEEVMRLEAAVEVADERGDVDEVNRLEAHFWLDGPTSAEGRVSGPARALFLDMNGIALAATPPGSDRPPEGLLAWERLEEIEAPTLVVVGDLDAPDVIEYSRAIARRVPGAELRVIEGTAHLPQLEQPERLAEEIRRFLASQGL